MKTFFLRTLFFAALLLLIGATTHGQSANGVSWDKYYFTGSMSVGAGKSYAPNGAILQVGSDNSHGGILLPRIAHVSDIPSPAKGLIAYCNDSSGVVVFNGTAWSKIGGGVTGNYLPTNFNSGQVIAGNGNALFFNDIPFMQVNSGVLQLKAPVLTIAGDNTQPAEIYGYTGIQMTSPNNHLITDGRNEFTSSGSILVQQKDSLQFSGQNAVFNSNVGVGGKAKSGYKFDVTGGSAHFSYHVDLDSYATVGTRSAQPIGWHSFVAGTSLSAQGEGSVAMGTATNASGRSSIAMSRGANAYGNETFALGGDARPLNNDGTIGSRAIACGIGTFSTANRAAAYGVKTSVNSFGEMAVGFGNASLAPYNRDAWDNRDILFSIGCSPLPDFRPNDTAISWGQSNAVTVWKSGHTRIGLTTGKLVNAGYTLEVGGSLKLCGRVHSGIDSSAVTGITDSSLVFINYGPTANIPFPNPALYKGRILHFANHGTGDATLSYPIYLDALTPITVVSWIWPNNRYACISDGFKWYAL